MSFKADKLMFALRYEDAARIYRSALDRRGMFAGPAADYGRCMLALRKYKDAYLHFAIANERSTDKLVGVQAYLSELGVAKYLLGLRGPAARVFMRGIQGIENHSIHYAEDGVGYEHGLLLWYAGVSMRFPDFVHRASRYLEQRMKFRLKHHPSDADGWLTKLIRFVLGKGRWEEALCALLSQQRYTRAGQVRPPRRANGDPLDSAIQQAKTDIWLRRRLVRLLFYRAVRERWDGRPVKSKAWFRICRDIENPILEVEWYLARAEAESRRSPRGDRRQARGRRIRRLQQGDHAGAS